MRKGIRMYYEAERFIADWERENKIKECQDCFINHRSITNKESI